MSQELPTWLAEPPAYEPPRDRDGFVRTNLLRLAALPARMAQAAGKPAFLDRLLQPVPALVRFAGLIVSVVCVSAATNMAFVWVVFAAILVSLALRPLPQLRATAPVAALAALIAGLVVLPGALMGMAPPSLVVRMAVKTFCTVGLTLGLAQGVPWSRMASALTGAHVPAAVVFVADAAMRGIFVLGRVAQHLNESLALRSVGHNQHKSGSAGAIMGMTFVRASIFAGEQAEAMACRGYDGTSTAAPERASRVAGVLYALAIICVVALFVWFERAMGVG